MKLKSVKILQIIAIAIQTLAAVAVVLFTLMQSVILEQLSGGSGLSEIQALPVSIFLDILSVWVIYIIGYVVMMRKPIRGSRTKAIVFVVVLIAVSLLLNSVASLFLNYYASLKGAMALAAQATLENFICVVTDPLKNIAAALFFVSCGGYCGIEDRENTEG